MYIKVFYLASDGATNNPVIMKKGILTNLKHLYNQGGIHGLYQGIIPSYF